MTIRKLGDKKCRNGLRLFIFIASLSTSGICCGGAQLPEGYDCESELKRIETEDYCDLVLVERLETQIVQFRKNCTKQAEQAKTLLADKLNASGKCANKKNALQLHHKRCTEQIEAASLGMECAGADCDDYKLHVDQILDECSDPELGGVYVQQADDLYKRLEERKKDGKRLSSLIELSDSCANTMGKVTDKNAKLLFENTIKSIRKKGRIKVTPSEGSEFELVRSQALASCEQALLSTVEIITAKYSAKLGSNRLKNNRKKWKKVYKKLKGFRSRLNKVKAETFFPIPLELVENTINEFDPDVQPMN